MIDLVQVAAQATQRARPAGGPPPGFSFTEALFQLVQFVGFFLAIGAVGFRFGVVRQVRGISYEARRILRADNAAMLGLIGVVLLFISFLGAPTSARSQSTKRSWKRCQRTSSPSNSGWACCCSL
jgi:hypothetical protein